MNKRGYRSLAKKIIKNNIYLSLGTCAGEKPWVSPVFYRVDGKYNFYFGSQLHSLHTKNVLKNPIVSFAIFDSTQKEGTGVGVQASAKVQMLSGHQLRKAIKYYKSAFVGLKAEDFEGNNPYRIFQLKPSKFYVTDPECKVDRRVEVKL